MSEKPYYEESPKAALRSWVMFQMLRGAGWAGAVLLGIWVVFLILGLVRSLLPVNPNAALDLGTALLALA